MFLFVLKLMCKDSCYFNGDIYCLGEVSYFQDFIYADSFSMAYSKLVVLLDEVFEHFDAEILSLNRVS